MSNIVISEGTKVTLHFSVGLEKGEVIDSTFNEEPATFTVGDGNLLEGFEDCLMGLSVGSKKIFVVTPEKGFGQHNPENIQTISSQHFAGDMELRKGLIVSFADAQKAELPGVIVEVQESEVTVDFNHPLAGKNVQFEVEILNVEPVVKH